MNFHGEPWELLFETKRAVVRRLMAQSVVPPELAPQPEPASSMPPGGLSGDSIGPESGYASLIAVPAK